MAEKTRPLSLRLKERHIEELRARAYTLSATITGVARDLILTGLAGGDNKSLAERLMHMERRLAGLEQSSVSAIQQLENLNTIFDALLTALSDAPQAESSS